MKANKLFLKGLITLLVVTLITVSTGITPVKAALPSMSVYPATQTALTCDETLITIRVGDINPAYGLYAYDVKVSFPVGKFEVLEVTNGDILDDTGYFLRNVVEEISGNVQVWVAYTQQAPSTPKSGSGDLIFIRVRALTTGETVPITITYQKLSTITGSQIAIPVNNIFNGTVTTSNDCPPVALWIDPAETLACLIGDDTIVKVNIRYAEDLWAYDLRLSFDPQALDILDVVNGDFLEEGIYGALTWDDTAGTIQVAMSQSSPQTPKTGAGTLMVIRLRPKADQLNEDVTMTISPTSELLNYDILPLAYTTVAGMLYTNDCDPTSVDLTGLTASGGVRSAIINWETANEVNNLGFNIYRANTEKGKRVKLNELMIPTRSYPGSQAGAYYEYVDTDFPGKPGNGEGSGTILRQAKNGRTYYYWLESVSINGGTELMGPVEARVLNK